MKKNIFKLSVASLITATSLNAGAELTGDTKLACEAILCLSTGTRPAECAPSIARYFSISAKKWVDTIAKRKSFLNLCPVVSSDAKFLQLKNEIITNMESDCTAEYLNSRLQYQAQEVQEAYTCGDDNRRTCYRMVTKQFIRINPVMPRYCQLLQEHEYTDKHLKYTCNNQYYSPKEWQAGEKIITITSQEYQKLSKQEQAEYTAIPVYQYFGSIKLNNIKSYKYQKQEKINKNCWVE